MNKKQLQKYVLNGLALLAFGAVSGPAIYLGAKSEEDRARVHYEQVIRPVEDSVRAYEGIRDSMDEKERMIQKDHIQYIQNTQAGETEDISGGLDAITTPTPTGEGE